uniref:Mutator family transposase n=1 Tax=Rhodococcus sp. NS1 TaxID=402236 RepID=A0A097SQT6_9NOCA|nr:hypothetical protein LRS1606.450 [Rhodococcus sp. NS1]
MSEVLPLLYLHGLSTSDFGPALEQFLGSGADLSPASITRLIAQWQDEAKALAQRDLSQVDYVYLWVYGVRVKVRLEQEKLCLLVMLGVRADGRKELVALADGYRESTESWADLLRDCRRRGMRAPVLAIGDEGTRFEGGRYGDGLQADRGDPVAVAGGQCPQLVALVRAGAVFHKGKLLERPVDITPEPSPDTPASEVA